ncbi:MAG: hypothetical protein ACLFTT_00870 [Candidatus Hydrogenedentota bacterium]
MPKWRIVATIIVIIALLALFALMFFQWVLPAADTSGTAFTMGLPLLILGMIVLIVIIALIARRRMPTGRFVWLEDGAPPDTGGPWQYWGEKQMLACPHCGEKLDAAALAGDVQNVIAQIGANTTPVRRHTCPQCQARWESRLSDRPVDYRARVPKVHYDWRPVSGYAATGPPQHARKTTEAAQQQPDQRTEARRILQHYLREAQQQGAGTREEQVRRAEQQTLRVLMNRHSLAPDEAARLLEQAKRILQGQSPPPA